MRPRTPAHRQPKPRPQRPSRLPGRKQARRPYPPPLRAALVFILPWLVFQMLGALIFFTIPNLLSIAVLIIYLANGYLAAEYYRQGVHRDPHFRNNCIKNGAGAGLTLSIGGWLIFTVMMLILGLFTGGLAWAGSATLFITGPLDVMAGLLLGALGGAGNGRN